MKTLFGAILVSLTIIIGFAGCSNIHLVQCYTAKDCQQGDLCKEGRCLALSGHEKTSSDASPNDASIQDEEAVKILPPPSAPTIPDPPAQVACKLRKNIYRAQLGNTKYVAASSALPVFVTGDNFALYLWDKRTLRISDRFILPISFPKRIAIPQTIAFHPTQPVLALVIPSSKAKENLLFFRIVAGSSTLQPFRFQRLAFRPQFFSGSTPELVHFAPSGRYILLFTRTEKEGNIEMISSPTHPDFLKKAHRYSSSNIQAIKEMVVTPDEKWLIAAVGGYYDRALRIWSLTSQSQQIQLQPHKTVNFPAKDPKHPFPRRLSLHPKGQMAALSHTDRIELYEVPSLKKLTTVPFDPSQKYGGVSYNAIFLQNQDILLTLAPKKTSLKAWKWKREIPGQISFREISSDNCLYHEDNADLFTLDTKDDEFYAFCSGVLTRWKFLPSSQWKKTSVAKEELAHVTVHPHKPIEVAILQNVDNRFSYDKFILSASSMETGKVLWRDEKILSRKNDGDKAGTNVPFLTFLADGSHLLGYQSWEIYKASRLFTWKLEGEPSQGFKVHPPKKYNFNFGGRGFFYGGIKPLQNSLYGNKLLLERYAPGHVPCRGAPLGYLSFYNAIKDTKGNLSIEEGESFATEPVRHKKYKAFPGISQSFNFFASGPVISPNGQWLTGGLTSPDHENQDTLLHLWKLEVTDKKKVRVKHHFDFRWTPNEYKNLAECGWASDNRTKFICHRFGLVFSPRSDKLVQSFQTKIYVWDLTKSPPQPTVISTEKAYRQKGLFFGQPHFHPSGAYLATFTNDENGKVWMHLWDLRRPGTYQSQFIGMIKHISYYHRYTACLYNYYYDGYIDFRYNSSLKKTEIIFSTGTESRIWQCN